LKGIPQGRYTREFRQEAVKLVVEEKISCREAAQRLSLAPSTLAYWVKVYKSGKLGEIGKAQKPLTEVEMELARTKKELAEVKMERDILKKQPRTLSRSRCKVRGDEADAAPLPHIASEPDSEGLSQRFLRLD
jgi:transposase-like protein